MDVTYQRRDRNDYTVDLNAGVSPATVTFTTAPSSGTTVCIQRWPDAGDTDRRNDREMMEFRQKVMRAVRDFFDGAGTIDFRVVSVANIDACTELGSIPGRDTPPSVILAYQDGAGSFDEATLYLWDGRSGFTGLGAYSVNYAAGDGGWVPIAGRNSRHVTRSILAALNVLAVAGPAAITFIRFESDFVSNTAANTDVGGFFARGSNAGQLNASITFKTGTAHNRGVITFTTQGSGGTLSATQFNEDQTAEVSDWALSGTHGLSAGVVRAALITGYGARAVRKVWSGPYVGAGAPVNGMVLTYGTARDRVLGHPALNVPTAPQFAGILYVDSPVAPAPTSGNPVCWVVEEGPALVNLGAYSSGAAIAVGDWVHTSWATAFMADVLGTAPTFAAPAAPAAYAGGAQSLNAHIGYSREVYASPNTPAQVLVDVRR